MITDIAEAFGQTRIVTITDSWFDNNGLFKPLHKQLSTRFQMVSRLRSNNTVFKLPELHLKKGPGRPRKYGKKLGDAASLAVRYKPLASEYSVSK